VDYFMVHDYNTMYTDSMIDIQYVATYLLKKAYVDLKCRERLRDRNLQGIPLTHLILLNECNILWDIIQVHKLTPADVACLPPAPPNLDQQIAALTHRVQDLEAQVEILQYAPGGPIASAAQVRFETTLALHQETHPDALDA
jgi:hypothetical protein